MPNNTTFQPIQINATRKLLPFLLQPALVTLLLRGLACSKPQLLAPTLLLLPTLAAAAAAAAAGPKLLSERMRYKTRSNLVLLSLLRPQNLLTRYITTMFSPTNQIASYRPICLSDTGVRS